MQPYPPTRRAKDYILPFLIIIALGVVAALTIRLLGLLGSEDESGFSISGKANLEVATNEVEAYLPAAEGWKIIEGTTMLSSGEKIRTDASGSATLTFDEGSVLDLGPNTEIEITDLSNSLTQKNVTLSLVRGSAGVAVGSMSGDLKVQTELLEISETDGKFIITKDEDEESVSVINGGLLAQTLDAKEGKKMPVYEVKTGETLEISERRINLLRVGGEIELVKETPSEVKNEELYLALSGGLPEETNNEEEAQSQEGEETVQPDSAGKVTLTAPLVVSGNGEIHSVTQPISVKGKASPLATKIEVSYEGEEAYALSKFQAGDSEWEYRASTEYGNLAEGVNHYQVVAVDADGVKSAPTPFTIIYAPEGGTEEIAVEEAENTTEETESNSETTEKTTENIPNGGDGIPSVGDAIFPPPVIASPEDGAVITTVPVRIEGSVPNNTKEVYVNGYKLTKFQEGDVTWYYNASPDYDNLEVGENEYEVEAVSVNGDKSSVKIKITFAPEEKTEE